MEQYETELTVPIPGIAHPSEVIRFIDIWDGKVIKQIRDQLIGLGKMIPENLDRIFKEKIERGYIFKTQCLWSTDAKAYQEEKEDLQRLSEEYWFELKGVHVRRYRTALEECCIYEKVWLKKDPRNKYDCNAIKVTTVDGTIGHVPAMETGQLLL
jgi:polyphosphate kinase